MATPILLKDSTENPLRLSFNDLWEAKQFRGKGEFRYRAVALLGKAGPQLKIVEAAILAEAQKTWPDKLPKPTEEGDTFAWQAMLRSFKGNSLKFCLTNGDLTDTDGHAGMVVLAANRKQIQGGPEVVDFNKVPLEEGSGKPYSGCYINLSAEIWAQNNENKGIRCCLLAVQYVRPGDAFAGGTRPSADVFDDLSPELGSNVVGMNGSQEAVGGSFY